jgi:uncharacterized protein (TIGR02117 family)
MLGWTVALSPFAIVAGYAAASAVLMRVPVNRRARPADAGVRVWAHSNGMHVDLVLPRRTEVIDWAEVFPPRLFPAVDDGHDHVAIGWGDRGIWLDTPTWAELRASVAFKALARLSTTLVHVTYMRSSELVEGPRCRSVQISPAQYAELVAYVRQTLAAEVPEEVHVAGHHYGQTDAFFAARGRYHAFKTCNVWANEGLKVAGVKTAVWTPMAKGVLYHLPKPSAPSGTAAACAPADARPDRDARSG